jgi:hypothetical protein
VAHSTAHVLRASIWFGLEAVVHVFLVVPTFRAAKAVTELFQAEGASGVAPSEVLKLRC